jgi:hypothetical protein
MVHKVVEWKHRPKAASVAIDFSLNTNLLIERTAASTSQSAHQSSSRWHPHASFGKLMGHNNTSSVV